MLSENEILQIIKHKNQNSFDKLYYHYAPALYGKIIQMTTNVSVACAILQKSFIEIWHTIESYLHSKSILFIWMFRIVIKHCKKSAGCTKDFTMSVLLGY